MLRILIIEQERVIETEKEEREREIKKIWGKRLRKRDKERERPKESEK